MFADDQVGCARSRKETWGWTGRNAACCPAGADKPGPWIRSHVPVGCVCDTCQSIVPSEECCCESEATTTVDELWVWGAVNEVQVAGSQKEEGHVKGEEEQEECDGRFQCAEQEDEGEDEPALLQRVNFWILLPSERVIRTMR